MLFVYNLVGMFIWRKFWYTALLTDEADVKNMEKLIDLLEDNDDVQNVWHNWDQD